MREIEMNTKRGGWTDANSCQVRSAFLNYYLCCGSVPPPEATASSRSDLPLS